MKILVTGFDPFGGEKTNPSIEVVNRLPNDINGTKIVKLEIPTVFNKSAEVLEEALELEKPDYVLCLGQAGGRDGLTPERVAINQDDARIPDNEGNQPIDQVIRVDGENAYFSQLPIKAMVKAMQEVGIPASISNSAGTFVCNHVMYQALYLTNKKYPNIKAGFIHVPFMPEQIAGKRNTPSMNLNDIVKGIEAAIQAIITHHQTPDIKITGGTLH